MYRLCTFSTEYWGAIRGFGFEHSVNSKFVTGQKNRDQSSCHETEKERKEYIYTTAPQQTESLHYPKKKRERERERE
jgi:hypothetical protein